MYITWATWQFHHIYHQSLTELGDSQVSTSRARLQLLLVDFQLREYGIM